MLDRISTGHNGLDEVLDYLRPGDNVVWQVDSVDDYCHFVLIYLRQALKDRRRIIYFRFAAHKPLVDEVFQNKGVTIIELQADGGFESFTSKIYWEISKNGPEAFYLFDCLSDLLAQWSSDLMIGNFFRITCPYLYELDTIAYFALIRGYHAYDAIARIRETTQILIDLYSANDSYYVHPLKVWQRYAPTMFLPHKVEADICLPISGSAEAAALFAAAAPDWSRPSRQIDYWDRLFLDAEETGNSSKYYSHLSNLLIGRQSRIDTLAASYFQLTDLINIKQRQIGTGKIGGKAVGMLLARKIIEIEADRNERLSEIILEPHDSFFLGSDLYYTYIVQNGWWKLRTEQKTDAGYFSRAGELRQKLLTGTFPDYIQAQFRQMLDYFGQSPIIVRSSSLLEDDFGNAFAGKYESVFCANQGNPEQRLQAFEDAVRTVYSSMFNESALSYRQKRGLQDKDEQMAILIQRVSGSYRGRFFYPLLAGVCHSINLYVWDEQMDPSAGMMRLVCGLGTRAVDRVEKDYPKIIALDNPVLSSFKNREEEKEYSQHYIDMIDLEENKFCTRSVSSLIGSAADTDLKKAGDLDWESFLDPDHTGRGKPTGIILNFRKIISENNFIRQMNVLSSTLEKAYDNPADLEFTANISSRNRYMINILQCRPLQGKQIGSRITIPKNIDIRNILIRNNGGFMGGNVNISVNYILYVMPEEYIQLREQERYQVARIIGNLNKKLAGETILLIGPGRWGTTTTTMGIPVNFSEINNITALGELAFENAGMIPELSFGSHFFQDLIETDIFYLSLMPHLDNNIFREDLIISRENKLSKYLDDYAKWQAVIHLWDCRSSKVQIYSDIYKQLLLCTTYGHVVTE